MLDATAAAPSFPAEWEAHDWVWIGFPHDASQWPGALEEARANVAEFANAVQMGSEQVRLIVRDQANAEVAATLVHRDVNIRLHRFGDIWLRDTGPVIVQVDGQQRARLFDFNGWGGKYDMEGDKEIGSALAAEGELPADHCAWVFEGGALDSDGTGLAVTTEQCLLNANRNGNASKQQVEAQLRRDLGIEKLLWLGNGLTADHTDGHVDNLARFVAPATLAIPQAEGTDDPNAAIYADARARAKSFGIDVVDIPSPGRVEQHGYIIPASYMNFYIANEAVIVPVYGQPNDRHAVEAIGACFPGRKAIGIPALGIVQGGGSFHCCSQQMPCTRRQA